MTCPLLTLPDNRERVLNFGGVWAAWYLGMASLELSQAVLPLLPTLKRSMPPKIFIVGGHGGRGERQQPYPKMEAFDPTSHAWEILDGPSLPRTHAVAVAVQHYLYVLGGRTHDDHATTSVDRLDVYRDSAWQCAPSLTIARYSAAALCLSGTLCILGGFDGVEALDSCEVLRHDDSYMEADSWCCFASLPLARGRHAAVAVLENVYLLGGMDGGYRSLDLASQASWQRPVCQLSEWSSLPSMHHARSGCAAGVVHHSIVVVGGVASGWTTLSSVERFQLQSRHWETVAPMGLIRRECAAVSLPGQLWVLGGASYGGWSSGKVEILTLAAEGAVVWQPGPAHTPRSGCSAAILRG